MTRFAPAPEKTLPPVNNPGDLSLLEALLVPQIPKPLQQRALTDPRGAMLPEAQDPELKQVLDGVTKARIILFDPKAPHKIVLRQGERKLSVPGGNLELHDNSVTAACREVVEEARVRIVANLQLVTILSESAQHRVSREKWNAWGYSTQGHTMNDKHILLGTLKTAFFSAPLSEGFRRRMLEGRAATLLDLNAVDFSNIRAPFRHLLKCWRGNARTDIPLAITHS